MPTKDSKAIDTDKMIYGMKDLKVGINPRFILQTKKEFKGFKIQASKKENVLDSSRFENLNL